MNRLLTVFRRRPGLMQALPLAILFLAACGGSDTAKPVAHPAPAPPAPAPQTSTANHQPTIFSVSVSMTEDAVMTGTVPAAADPDGDSVTYRLEHSPSYGTLKFNGDGRYEYRPAENFVGTVIFAYRAVDARGTYDTGAATVTISVTPINDPPKQVGASLALSMDTPSGGRVRINSPGGETTVALRVAVQADDRILASGTKDIWWGTPWVARFDADGVPDPGFGNGAGEVNIASINTSFGLLDMNVAADGKILLAGETYAWLGSALRVSATLLRLDPDGKVDRSFGGTGQVSWSPPSGSFSAYQVWPLPDGRILAAAYGSSKVLLRYNASGLLDTSFGGGDGVITGDHKVLPDGRILVVGPRSDSDSTVGLARYLPGAAALDMGFGGGDGFVETSIRRGEAEVLPQLQPDGRILLAGCSDSGSVALQRYEANGAMDASFGGGDGLVVTAPPGSNHCAVHTVHFQENGGIVVYARQGTAQSGSSTTWFRFHPDGTLDSAFSGIFEPEISDIDWIPADSTTQSDGRIVRTVVEPRPKPPYYDMSLASWYLERLQADGTPDPYFGTMRPLVEGVPFSRTIPAGTFADVDGDVLTGSATLVDGSPLPAWLSFNGTSRTFSGTPPVGAPDLHLKITFTDPGGLSVSDTMLITFAPAPAGH